MRPVRFIVVALMCALGLFGVARSALAVTGTCSSTTVSPGQTISVTGGSGSPGEAVTLYFATTVIGGSTVDGAGFYSVSGLIPSGATPGTYAIQVGAPVSGGTTPCNVTVVPAAAATPTPTPTPVVTPAPTATAAPVAVATFPPFPIILQQQQQQQQQQGGGGGGSGGPSGRGGQQQQHSAGPGGQQQQQQQQQQDGGGILPRTGADTGRMAVWGGGLLGLGLLLVMFARRRRRRARRRALAELPPIEAVVVEPEYPWLPGTAHPSEFLTEADGVPPVYLAAPEQLYLPPVRDDDDILTPSF